MPNSPEQRRCAQTCEVDQQQLRLRAALSPPEALQALVDEYLAASKAKFPRRPIGRLFEPGPPPALKAGAPAAWNPTAELRNLNRKRCAPAAHSTRSVGARRSAPAACMDCPAASAQPRRQTPGPSCVELACDLRNALGQACNFCAGRLQLLGPGARAGRSDPVVIPGLCPGTAGQVQPDCRAQGVSSSPLKRRVKVWAGQPPAKHSAPSSGLWAAGEGTSPCAWPACLASAPVGSPHESGAVAAQSRCRLPVMPAAHRLKPAGTSLCARPCTASVQGLLAAHPCLSAGCWTRNLLISAGRRHSLCAGSAMPGGC